MPHERIGVFGGTFDPPHVGHLILANETQEQLELTRILWVLTPVPPHKLDQAITPLEHRLAMLDLAIANNPHFELSRVEIDRPGPHYALDTMALLTDQYTDTEITYLVGGDSLHDLPEWHRPKDFIRLCHTIGVMRRPGDSIDLTTLESILPGISIKVRFVDAPLLDISASDIRRRVAEGHSFRYYLPAVVYQYILEHNLYHG